MRTHALPTPATSEKKSALLKGPGPWTECRAQWRPRTSAPADPFEREAKRVAERVMRPSGNGAAFGGACLRTEPRPSDPHFTTDRVQTHRVGSGVNLPTAVGSLAKDVLRTPGQPIDSNTRSFMESRFGHDFGQVRIHADASAGEAASHLSARAFTSGQHVVFGTGEYQPTSTSGRWLLAHELSHTLQQEGAGTGHIQRFLTCETDAECPPRAPGEIGRSRRSPMELHEVTSGGTGRLVSNFGVDQSNIRGDLTSNPDWEAFVRAVSTESQLTWEILGFSDCHGDEGRNSALRGARAESLFFALPPDAQRQVDLYHGAPIDQCVRPNSTEEERALNRSALIWLRTTIFDEDEFTPTTILGIVCPCDASTEVDYDTETFRFLTSIEPLLRSNAGARGVSIVAIAGAIADEYNTRRGFRTIVDDVQDAVIDALPEVFIDVDRFFDIHHKLLNTLENDVGPANINVRTALELVQSGELTVPGSPTSDVQVNAIVDFLMTERGTVEAATSVIARAERLFGPDLSEHSDALHDAVLVEYFKQGDSYYDRFAAALAEDPDHKACPGDGGCRVLHNRDRILDSLSVHAGEPS